MIGSPWMYHFLFSVTTPQQWHLIKCLRAFQNELVMGFLEGLDLGLQDIQKASDVIFVL